MVTSRTLSDPTAQDHAFSLERLLASVARNRLVAPSGQPFAFSTHTGKVRKANEDNAVVAVGRRRPTQRIPFLGAVLCDGMGGLVKGDEAAILAASTATAALVSTEALIEPHLRMELAIRMANAAVFKRFRGEAGAVLVSALLEDDQVVIGWLGDARIYGIHHSGRVSLLTRDDTVAGAIADLEGAAPDAMDALLGAIGQRQESRHHVITLEERFRTLVLVSDGVHRIEPPVLSWLFRHSQTPAELAPRLVSASYWEGGHDNATALVIDLDRQPVFDETGEGFAVWAESQPRVWNIIRNSRPSESREPHKYLLENVPPRDPPEIHTPVANTPVRYSVQDSLDNTSPSGVAKRSKRRRDKSRAESENVARPQSHNAFLADPKPDDSKDTSEGGRRESADSPPSTAVEHVRSNDRSQPDVKVRAAKEPQLPLGIEQLPSPSNSRSSGEVYVASAPAAPMVEIPLESAPPIAPEPSVPTSPAQIDPEPVVETTASVIARTPAPVATGGVSSVPTEHVERAHADLPQVHPARSDASEADDADAKGNS